MPYRTFDTYELSFNDQTLEKDEDKLAKWKEMIEEYDLAEKSRHYSEFKTLPIGTVEMDSSWEDIRKICWIAYSVYGSGLKLSVTCSEDEGPMGCDLNTHYHFSVDTDGNYTFEIDNELFFYEQEPGEEEVNDECYDREKDGVEDGGTEADAKFSGNMKGKTLEDFLNEVPAKM